MSEVSSSADPLSVLGSDSYQPELHSHNQYEQLMDALPQMMWVANAEGAIDYL